MPDTYVYDDVAWRGPLTDWHIWDDTAWRDLSDVWVYDDTAWRKVFEATSCVCTGVSIDAFAINSGVSTCTCQTSPKVIQQVRVCLKWNYSGATNACHHAHTQYSTTGSSYFTLTDNLAVNVQSPGTLGCTGTYEGEYEFPLCRTQRWYYRVRLELDSDSTVCDTSSAYQSTFCLS
jgi:hypothetical protein